MRKQVTHKILILCCLLVLLMCVVATPTPMRQSTGQRSNESEEMIKAKASWPTFFVALRRALGRHDQHVLRNMMSTDFQYQETKDKSVSGDKRDLAFRTWSKDWPNDWWNRLLATFKYLGPYKKDREQNQNGQYNSFARESVYRGAYAGAEGYCYAQFEFRNDGRWYFTQFYCGGGE
jgi:hypothetical protein